MNSRNALRTKQLLLVCLVKSHLLLLACSPNEDSTSFEVEKFHQELAQAINTGDLDSIMAFYTDDVVMVWPDQPFITGKKAVRALIKKVLDKYILVENHFPVETLKYDDVILHRGIARGSLTPRDGGEPIIFENKYVHILRRGSDGRLRVVWDAFNANPSK